MEASPKRAAPIETRVGIRELRHDFRAWLDRARAGERVIVTDRGVPVAELRTYGSDRTWLEQMYDTGQVIQATASLDELPRPSGPISTVGTDVLKEMREERA
jgi:prevent-host-death family protein